MKRIKRVDIAISYTPQDINKMTRKELARVVSVLVSANNKRLRRLESAGWTNSPAYQKAIKKGDFSVKGKNLNQLRLEYKRAREFYEMKTSSKKNFKSFRKETYKRLGGGFTSQANENKFWKLYNKLNDLKGLEKGYESENAQRMLYQLTKKNPRLSQKKLLAEMEDKINELYESAEELNDEGFYELLDEDEDDEIF